MQLYEVDQCLLDSAIEAVDQIIMQTKQLSVPVQVEQGLRQNGMGVLIGITGDVQGRFIFEGSKETFGVLGEAMFGMPLEGEMLHSFVGELANMIAGTTSTLLSGKGNHVDITPPTVMVGQMDIYGFETGLKVSVQLEQAGDLDIILLLQKRGSR